jgi:hypothetical protein
MPPFPFGGAKIEIRTGRENGATTASYLEPVFTMHRLAPFRWSVVILLGLALALEVVNGRFWLNDLKVYVMAADALRHGDAVYGLPFGLDTGYYKYAPGLLYLFMPYTLVPFPVACVLHFTLIGFALVSVFERMERLLMRHVFLTHPPRLLLRSLLGFLCIAVHVVRELHLGNVNVLLLWCMVVAMESLLEEEDVKGGILFGLAILVKPYFLLCTLPLVVLKRWSALVWITVPVALGLLLPLAFEGPATGWSLNTAWLDAMRAHGDYLSSANTLRAITSSVSGSPLPAWTDLAFIGGAAILVAAVTLRSGEARNEGLVLGVALALALVPLLVITDVQHFLLALPLVLWTLAHLFMHRAPWLAVFFTFAMLAYGTDSTDLWGRELAGRLEQAGAVGMGAMLLVITALLLANRPAERAVR